MACESATVPSGSGAETGDQLVFPDVLKSHILNCSFHSWYPIFEDVTLPARLIPLSPAFISYLRADGIVLPDDEAPGWSNSDDDHDSGVYSASASEAGAQSDEEDVAAEWRQVHDSIRKCISNLGGIVHPKLNWSAPKDAVWVSPDRSMACRTASELYMMLKSSSFVSHDLVNAFDGTIDDTKPVPKPASKKKRIGKVRFADVADEPDHEQPAKTGGAIGNPSQDTDNSGGLKPHVDLNGASYHLILRPTMPEFLPSLEFRCFVRDRKLIAISQRDKSFLPFLFRLRPRMDYEIRQFFHTHIRHSFPDPNFAFDVYVPEPYNRVWLIDVNPWAPRTDSLLFDWLELLTMATAPDVNNSDDDDEPDCDSRPDQALSAEDDEDEDGDRFCSSHLPSALNSYDPHFRLVRQEDPCGWNIGAAAYGAHKLPQDVLVAGSCNAGDFGLREFATQWFKSIERHERKMQLPVGALFSDDGSTDESDDDKSGSDSDSAVDSFGSSDDSDDSDEFESESDAGSSDEDDSDDDEDDFADV